MESFAKQAALLGLTVYPQKMEIVIINRNRSVPEIDLWFRGHFVKKVQRLKIL